MCRKLTMFTINKWILAGLAVVVGEMITVNPSNAQNLQHDTSSIPVNQSPVDNGVPNNSVNGAIDPDTGFFTVEGLGTGNEITIPPGVLQFFNNLNGTGSNILSADSSSTITICFSDPCVPSGESTRAITLNELAELMEKDLQQSLNDLAAAEAAEKRAEGQPRKFVRRRSSDCVNPAIQAREIVSTKLEESQKFVEQIEQLNPDNNIW